MKKFDYIKSLSSPFKPFGLKWYCGKTAIGTPYFFPRRWVKDPDKPGYTIPVPKKIGFDTVSLGWKLKWDSYRFEWTPLISFVFFGLQIAVIVNAPHQDHYWESWLYYEYNTDKTKTKQERIALCREKAPQTWTTHSENKKKTIDYYDIILKNKYL